MILRGAHSEFHFTNEEAETGSGVPETTAWKRETSSNALCGRLSQGPKRDAEQTGGRKGTRGNGPNPLG